MKKLRTIPQNRFIFALILGFLSISVQAQLSTISYTTDAAVVSQNFDALYNVATKTLYTNSTGATVTTALGPWDLSSSSVTNKPELAGWQITKLTGNTAAAATIQLISNTGGAGTIGFFNLGKAGVGLVSDRALGANCNSSLGAAIGTVLVNNTGKTLNSFSLSYKGEQWKSSTIAYKIAFKYAMGPTSTITNITNGTFTPVSTLDFTTPNIATTGAAIDGNDPANSTVISQTVSNISWLPGEALVLRWDYGNAFAQLAIDDLTFSAASSLSSLLTAQNINLLPPVTEPATNPFLSTAFNGVKTGDITFVPGTVGASEILAAAFAYLHPNSPYKGLQPNLDRLITLLDTTLSSWHTGRYPLNDMAFVLEPCCAYLMLKHYAPSAIPSARKAIWESGISKNINAILVAKPDLYTNHIVGSIWLNGDNRLAMAVYFGAIALGDTNRMNIAKTVIEGCMTKTLMADGGTYYVGYANESPSYHGPSTVRAFMWYYVFTKSTIIKNFLVGTNNYIPLIQIPIGEGFKEWTTSPPWKAYYNRTSLKIEALAKAYLGADAYNYGVAVINNPNLYKSNNFSNLYQSFLYCSGLASQDVPDNYMLFDRNCLGPRGRYGNWGVVGTLRDPSVPGPELTEPRYLSMDGISTFVGAFTLVSNANSTTYPLNAAFQGTAPEVKYAAGIETDYQRGDKWAFETGKDCKNAQTRTKNVFGLSTRYVVSKERFGEIGWNAQQQWVITPDRVIGMCEIENVSTTTSVYGLAQRIQLVSGRKGQTSYPIKKVNIIDANTYEYGDLRIKVISKNFNGTVDTITHGVMNEVDDKYSQMLVLNDALSGSDLARNYALGTRRYAFFEVTNKDRTYTSNSVRLTLAAGLEGFEFQESDGRKIRMVHNTTANSIVLNSNTMISPYSRTRLLKSWDESTMTTLTVSGGNTTIPYTTIPAYGHVLIINSDINDDHAAGYNTFDNIFNSTLLNKVVADSHKDFYRNVDLSKTLEVKNGFVKVPNDLPTDKLDILIYNMAGEAIKKMSVNGFSTELSIDISNQPKGIYVMSIRLNNSKELVYKLLKR